MTMRLFQVAMELKALTRNHWILGSAFELSHSNFPVPPAGKSDILFWEGYSLKYSGTLKRTLLRIPEKRARLDFSGSVGLGKQLGPDDYYGSFDSGILLEWYPHDRGVNHKTTIQFRTGALWGDVPFYEYFVMGREQDSDLLLRAHVPSNSEPKGDNPIARSYVLCNFEMDQMLYSNGLFALALTPFLDTGKGYDSSGQFGSPGWLADAGVQWKLSFMRLLEMKFSFGKNLRSGKGAFYFELSPF